MQFVEIEHKYLVPKDFSLDAFCAKLRAEKPTNESGVLVTDNYFLVRQHPHYVYRHRCDKEIQQLTVKSFGSGIEERLEVDLNLSQHKGDQIDAVRAFVKTFGEVWESSITKDVRVFYFDDCEVVHYTAKSQFTEVACVEFEAKHPSSKEQALAAIKHYEDRLGFSAAQRCKESLFELLFPKKQRPSWIAHT